LPVNGLSLLALVVAALAVLVAYRYGRMQGRGMPATTMPEATARAEPSRDVAPASAGSPAPAPAELAPLREALAAREAEAYQLRGFADDRRALLRELAQARGDVARYRQLVIDLENDAPPPILGERGMPDDLKLIVGIGPILERMLQQLGIATYRQIARWSERDIDDMDARLPEFPGRIRRDTWVTQARALHQSKYGEAP